MHTRGTGKGPKNCRYCGSAVLNMPGMFGVFTWRGDGNYKAHEAFWTYASSAVANRKALNGGADLVVRFIPQSALINLP